MYLPSNNLPRLRARLVNDGEKQNSRCVISNAVANQDALEIDRGATFGDSNDVLVNNLAGEDGKISALKCPNQLPETLRTGISPTA